MITVNKPFLPPKEEYLKLLEGVWKRNWLTNHGPLVSELEIKFKEYLGVEHNLFVVNGTFALQLAIKALELSGEVITTPFSYIATTSSLVWEGLTPVFADVDPNTLNMDPSNIEPLITENTTAIMATHVYGNPCQIDKIRQISDKHDLPVIYDAAHCFGTSYKGKSVLACGTISAISYHATKLFHTVEGGGVFTGSPELLEKMARLRNFGHVSAYEFKGAGVNGKASEMHAAMGLANIKYADEILTKRKQLAEYYDHKLEQLDVKRPTKNPEAEVNYTYYPIIFDSEEHLLKQQQILEENYIQTRRYFYPSLSQLHYINTKNETPIANDLASRVLCLPMYHELSEEEIDMIARLMLRTQNYNY